MQTVMTSPGVRHRARRHRAPRHRARSRPALALSAVLVLVGVAACGGSSSTSSSQTSASTRATTTTSSSTASTTSPATTSAGGAGGSASVTTGPVRAKLRGANHTPTANRYWSYSVRVTDASGHPLSGTVEIEFVFGGQVVGRDTPPTHPIKHGRWQDKLKFPPTAVGEPLTFRAVVHAQPGTVTLDWPITVRQ